MRNTKLPCLLGILLLSTLISCKDQNKGLASNQIDPAVNEKQLEEEEAKMFDAILKYDPDYWKNKVSDDYITINADGVMQTKSEIMADTARKNLFAGWTYKLFDRKVRQYGDVAIINGRSQFIHNATPFIEVYHTEIWVKQNGKWMFNGWQGTLTKEAQAAMMKAK